MPGVAIVMENPQREVIIQNISARRLDAVMPIIRQLMDAGILISYGWDAAASQLTLRFFDVGAE